MFCVTASFKDCTDGKLPRPLCPATDCKGDACNACEDLECDRQHYRSTLDWGNVRQLGGDGKVGDRQPCLASLGVGKLEVLLSYTFIGHPVGSGEDLRSAPLSVFLFCKNIRQLGGEGVRRGWGVERWWGDRQGRAGLLAPSQMGQRRLCLPGLHLFSPIIFLSSFFKHLTHSNKIDQGHFNSKRQGI